MCCYRSGGLLRLILDLAIAGVLAIAIVVALYGGFQFWLWSLRVSAHGLARPLAAGAVLTAFRVGISTRAQPHDITAVISRIGFLALSGAVVGTWFLFLVTSCGGADSYGYVSASRLLRSLRLSHPEPIAAYLPFPEAMTAVAPLGYVAAPDRDAIVPSYPLGLPLVMALFGRAFGDGGEFYVSPLLAALAATAAYGVARAFTDVSGAWLSAILVAVTPIFVNQAIQPMSDVAATFWILVGVWFLVQNHDRPHTWTLAAGIVAGMGFLTRPALLSAVVVFFVVALALRGRRAAAAFVVGFAPFLLFQAWLHWWLYGSILGSGYGRASYLFAIARVPDNVFNYFKWVNYSASPMFAITLLLGAFAFGSVAWWAAAVALLAGIAAPYFFYFTYDDWEATRFLLPGIAVAMVVCGVTARNLVARWTPGVVAPLIVLAIAYVAAAASYRFLDRHHTFALARMEARYPQVGQWIRQTAPPNTVVFAFQHSGSVRFYAARPTVRWDLMTGDGLSTSVATLKARGWHSWAVLDGPNEAAAFWPRVQGSAHTLFVEPAGGVHGVDIVILHPR